MAVRCLGSPRVPGRVGVKRPRRASFRIVLAIERCDVMAGRVQVLAAGQAPGAAHRLAAAVADPKPGWVVPAVDAQLDGVRQPEGHGYGRPPGVRGRRGSGPVLAGRHCCARRQILD